MMLPELFLIIGTTVCFDVGLPRIVKFAPHPMIPAEVSYEQKCYQPFRFSTSPATSEGEIAYRVVPAMVKIKHAHDWRPIRLDRYGEGRIDYWCPNSFADGCDKFQACSICHKIRRRKVTKTGWVEEP